MLCARSVRTGDISFPGMVQHAVRRRLAKRDGAGMGSPRDVADSSVGVLGRSPSRGDCFYLVGSLHFLLHTARQFFNLFRSFDYIE